jgi:hypothetical protein
VEEERLEKERETALLLAEQSLARARRLEKQQKFLRSRGKDMVRRGLKTLDELDEAEAKERQMESERATAEAAAMPSNVLVLSSTEADPFAGVEVPLLPPEVWAQWDSLYGNPQPSQDT